MSRFPGNIIKLPNVTPTQSSASGVWSLKDQMVYQRNNLWPFQRDPYFNYTTLLLQGNVPNTTGPQAMNLPLSYNADASTNNFLVTPNGDVGPRPFSPYFGSNYSVFFDGSGDNLNVGDQTAFEFGAGNFTVEAFIYPTSASGVQLIVAKGDGASFSGTEFDIRLNSGVFEGYVYLPSSQIQVTGAAVPLNTWSHVAFVRNGTILLVFVNGVQVGSSTALSTSAINTSSSSLTIASNASASANNFAGYISNVRLVKGTALYTTNFTPSTQPLQNITNTSLLTCQSNRFIDNSTANSGSGFTITRNGDSRITDNSPFVSTDFTTGAGYFTGATTDYFRIADNASLDMGSGSFTIECFYYPAVSITTAQGSAVFGKRATGGTYGGVTGEFYETYAPKFVSTVNGSSWGVNITSSILCVQNQWNHIAWVRNGDAWTIYVNGQAGGSVNLSGTIPDNTADFTIGATESSASSYKLRQGYLSDFRVVKGAAVYTGNFTPPSLGMLRTSGAASAAAYPSTTNVNTSFAESATSLLTLQTRAPSQNINFIDSSPNEFIVTKNGNTTQGTFSPFSPTGWGNRFDGSSGKLAFPTGSFVFGNSDFTIEAWVYNTGTTTGAFFTNQYTSGASTTSIIGAIGSTNGNFDMYIGGSVYSLTGINPTSNQWVHVAIVRTGGTVSVFQGGNRTHTRSDLSTLSINAGGTSVPPQIGDGVNGFLSNHRVIIGSGPYDATQASITVPTAPLTVTANTKLLTCQSNRFLDQTGKTITVTGTPSVQPFSPFAPANAVSPLVTGGSGYFDGGASSSADYLTWTGTAAGAGAFSYEFWVYSTNGFATMRAPLGVIAISGYNSALDIRMSGSTINASQYNVASNNFTVETLQANTWYHVVICRNTSNQMTVFLNGTRSSTGALTISTNFSGLTSAIGRLDPSNGGDVTGYITGVRLIVGSTPYDPTQTTIPVPTTPPTAIPNTSLLLNFTNGAAVDATGKNNLESVGKAQNSGVQAKWNYLTGGSSLYFDGSGYLIQNGILLPTTGDFTVEAWIRIDSLSATRTIFGCGQSSTKLAFYVGTGGAIGVQTGGSYLESAGSTILINNWYHVALTRTGNTYKIFVDGTEKSLSGAGTMVTTLSNSPQVIGAYSESFGTNPFSGYISNLRISTFRRYTTNFNTNLPTGPFPIG